jgi:hypothetical protein
LPLWNSTGANLKITETHHPGGFFISGHS